MRVIEREKVTEILKGMFYYPSIPNGAAEAQITLGHFSLIFNYTHWGEKHQFVVEEDGSYPIIMLESGSKWVGSISTGVLTIAPMSVWMKVKVVGNQLILVVGS